MPLIATHTEKGNWGKNKPWNIFFVYFLCLSSSHSGYINKAIKPVIAEWSSSTGRYSVWKIDNYDNLLAKMFNKAPGVLDIL